MNDQRTDVFDLGNSRALAQLALAAYAAKPAHPDVYHDEVTDTYATVTETDTDFTVAFCGTRRDIRDWLADLKCELIPCYFGGERIYVHSGFHADVASVWMPLSNRTYAAAVAAKRIWVTGHSKGAAEAVLFAWLLWRTKAVLVDAVYNFGQPRVGSWEFRRDYAACLGNRTFRVVHDADIVPHAPPWPFLHHSHEMFFEHPGMWREDAPLWWLTVKEAVAVFHRATKFRFAGLEDHSMVRYATL